jgi:hypothetical protein
MIIMRVVGLLAGLLGLVGVIVCFAGAYGVWLSAVWLYEVNDNVFAAVDRGMAKTQAQLRAVQKRVEQSKITSSEIKNKIRDWSVEQAKDRVARQLELDAQTQKLLAQIQTADSWLDFSAELIRDAQKLGTVGHKVGISVDTASLDEILEKVESARSKVQEAEQAVNKVREFAVDKDDEPSRLHKMSKLVVRTLVTFSSVDERLEEAATRLDKLQSEVLKAKTRTTNLITWTAIACWTLLAWIGAGQIALCWLGSKTCWRRSVASAVT